MANDVTVAGAAAESRDAAAVERSTENIGDMTEFVQWMTSNFGATIGVRQALQQAAFLLCCDVIAQDMAKATLRLRRRTSPKTSVIVMPTEHPVAAFLADVPNSRHTWFDFKEMLGLWGCITSNAHSAVIRNRFGEVLELVPLQTSRVGTRVIGREIFYDVTASTVEEQALLGASTLTLPERNMIHVRSRLLDGMNGFSTLVAGEQVLATGRAIEGYREQIFGEDGQIRGVFTRPDNFEPLPEVIFQRLKQQFRALMMRMADKGEPIVLEGGVKFDRISVNPEEAELTKQFEAQINATCRLLRVPPHKIFHLEGVKYENLETVDKMYLGDTLVPVCERYESRYALALLTDKERREFFLEHDRDEMAIKDTKAETERAVKSLERGAITIDEFRARLGYNELPNGAGKVRLVPVNMQLVDENNQVVLQASKGADKAGEEEAGPEEPDETETSKSLRLVHSN